MNWIRVVLIGYLFCYLCAVGYIIHANPEKNETVHCKTN